MANQRHLASGTDSHTSIATLESTSHAACAARKMIRFKVRSGGTGTTDGYLMLMKMPPDRSNPRRPSSAV